MARTNNLTNFLTDVASAIKTKKGDSTPILASNFDTEIANLPSGGSSYDYSQIGYSSEPATVSYDFNYAKDIYDDWDATETNLSNKFENDRILRYFPLVDTSSVTNMSNLFKGCSSLKEIPLLNTSSVIDMSYMFQSCTALETIPLINTSSVTNMTYMFYNCSSLKSIPLLNTSSVTNMRTMFSQCSNLEDVPLLDTSKITASSKINQMFNSCYNLTDTSLDNILQMCINSGLSSGTLSSLGFGSTSYPASRIEALPHYQDFIEAGWTIGY